jgi:predicted NUDIX family NTP pyrophosphohydrolase
VPKKSAGLLLFRRRDRLEVLLVHPGGPLWAKKDEGAWSIPKGEIDAEEDPLAAAQREFAEELGSAVSGEFVTLTPIRQASGKLVYAWALECDFDTATFRSGTFSMEWPPRSGREQHFPEVDRAEWFALEHARLKINKGQVPLLDQLNHVVEAGRYTRLQLSVCRSIRSTTSTSTGPRRASSFNPRSS